VAEGREWERKVGSVTVWQQAVVRGGRQQKNPSVEEAEGVVAEVRGHAIKGSYSMIAQIGWEQKRGCSSLRGSPWRPGCRIVEAHRVALEKCQLPRHALRHVGEAVVRCRWRVVRACGELCPHPSVIPPT